MLEELRIMLEFLIAGLLLIIIHFGEPVYYFIYVKRNKLDISPVYSEPPKVSIIIPTYNEGNRIMVLCGFVQYISAE